MGDQVGSSVAPNGAEKALLLPFKHDLSPDGIHMGSNHIQCDLANNTPLGSGEFGVVYPGVCNGEAVAVKTFKRSVEIDEFKAVLAEVKIMAYLGDHEHVVKFVGADISEISKRKVTTTGRLVHFSYFF